jgi:hypothetical protein
MSFSTGIRMPHRSCGCGEGTDMAEDVDALLEFGLQRLIDGFVAYAAEGP